MHDAILTLSLQCEGYEQTVRLAVRTGEGDERVGGKDDENLLVGEVVDAVEEDSDVNSDDEDSSGDDDECSSSDDGGNDEEHKTDDIENDDRGDKGDGPTLPSYAHKIEPMIASVMSAAQRMLVPGKWLSLDEQMCRFSGRSRHVYLIKTKPNPKVRARRGRRSTLH